MTPAACFGAVLIAIAVDALPRGARPAVPHEGQERLAAQKLSAHGSGVSRPGVVRRRHRRAVARTFGGTPTVGALFRSASSTSHSCTASVVHSPPGDVLLTAAHCVSGTGAGYAFAPGFHEGISPNGRWVVTAAYFDPAWLARHDPERDFVFLTVAPRSIAGESEQIERVTGANRLRLYLHRGDDVTIPAYPAGSDNDPIICTVPIGVDGPYPAFRCDPYVGGTSGSPFLVHTPRGTFVAGVIGGLHQGGCTSAISYSSPFGMPAERAYMRAVAGGPGDSARSAGSDGC